MIYLPYRVCEDCYLLFETLNDIKNYQIDIANLFRNPVNKVNFGFGFYTKEIIFEDKVELTKVQQNKIKMLNTEIDNLNKEEDDENDMVGVKNKTTSSNNISEEDIDNEENDEENEVIKKSEKKTEPKLNLKPSKEMNQTEEKKETEIVTKKGKINNLYIPRKLL